MKVRVEELSPIERKLSIEVEPAVVSAELDKAYRALSRHVKIAGFRPGKVPRRILEQRFKDQVEDDVIHRVVERAYLDAIREHKVEAVGSPQVTNDRLRPDQPFTFEARVEVKPKISAKDYKGLALTRRDVQVDDAKVKEQLEQMQKSHSRLEPIFGRDVAQKGDFVRVDYLGTIDGKEFPGGKAEDVTVEVAEGEVVAANVAALEGAKIGESREVDYTFPADYRAEELRGKTARFRFTVKELKQKVTPPLDDELAKELGAPTVAELEAKVRQSLERAVKQKVDGDIREELVHKLVEKNPIEVPRAMVDRAIELMTNGALNAMMRAGIDVRRFGMDMNRLREELRPKAELEVKGSLLFEAIAEQEGIQASDEDVEKKLEQLAEESGQPLSTVRKAFRSPDERQSLKNRLREEKTIEFLKAQATYG